MKNLIKTLFFVAIAFYACNKDKPNFSSISQYLNSSATIKNASDFPLSFIWEKKLPEFSPLEESKAFAYNTTIGDVAYLVNAENLQIQKFDLQNQQKIGLIDFHSISSEVKSQYVSCFILNANEFIWIADSTRLLVCNSAGQLTSTINLPLKYNLKQYFIAVNSNARIQADPESKTLIIPVLCSDDYEASKEHQLPRFVSYNLTTGETEFIPIHLPTEYPSDRYSAGLFDPFTAFDSHTFYALFPLVNKVFSYNLITKQVAKTELQLPVQLTPPASVQEPIDTRQIAENLFKSNRIKGFAVINGKYYIHQVDAWDETLESLKYIDNTALFVLSTNGTLIWGGRFPSIPFNNHLFDVHSASGKYIYFTLYKKNLNVQNADYKLVRLSG